MSGAQPADGPATVSSVTIGRRDTVRVALASLTSAVTSYVILALGARLLLPISDNTIFVTFWSTLFACFGVLSGLSIEVTRAVAASKDQSSAATSDGGRRHPRVLTVGAGIGIGAAVVGVATAPWWGPVVFPPGHEGLAYLVGLGVGAYALHSVVVGALAGRRFWGTYTGLIAADAVFRLLLVAAVAVAGATIVGFATAVVVAALTWLGFLLFSPRSRTAAATRADSPTAPFLGRIAITSVAAGASAVLVVGFPVLLAVTTPADVYAGAAPLLLAISLTRAPLLIPLNAYQGVAVSHFVAHRSEGLRAVLPAVRLVGLLGVVATGAAYLLGPLLLRIFLGPGYDLPAGVLAGLTAASVVLALLTLTGALCQALTMHLAFVTGWLVAVAVSVLLLLLPGSLETRAIVALAGGPAVGLVVHLTWLARRAPGRTTPTEEGPAA
jgi:O-antigen/teichoic acid export membrane protein